MTDAELLIEVRGVWGHLARARAVETVAAINGFTRSGVSGRVTRAERNAQAMLTLTDYLSKEPGESRAERRAKEIVAKSQCELERHPAGDYTAIYLSDIHFPEHNEDALSLFLTVLEDIPNVHYISALNDALDFAKISQWPERRSIRKQQLDHDFSKTLDTYELWMETLRIAAPNAKHIAIVGNHDARAARFGILDGASEVCQTYAMERLFEMGVLFPGLLLEETAWSPAPNTLWAHGQYTGVNLITVARKNYNYYKTINRIGHDYTLITGHAHRAADVTLPGGGRSIISGCFHHDHPAYMKTYALWDHAFVVTSVTGDKVFNDLVQFDFDDDGLFCRYNGKLYRVEKDNEAHEEETPDMPVYGYEPLIAS